MFVAVDDLKPNPLGDSFYFYHAGLFGIIVQAEFYVTISSFQVGLLHLMPVLQSSLQAIHAGVLIQFNPR